MPTHDGALRVRTKIVVPRQTLRTRQVAGRKPTQAHALTSLPAASQQILTGRQFFPALISGPFHHGLDVVFIAAAVMSVVAALASLLRGGKYEAEESVLVSDPGQPQEAGPATSPAAVDPGSRPGAVLSPGPGDGGGEAREPAELTVRRRLRYR